MNKNVKIAKELVILAKSLIAKNQAKKLLQYFKNEASNGLTNDQIQLLKQKIVNIQKQSFNFSWFTHRFITQHKHYEDIESLLKIQQAYKKLNKELRTFQFENNKSFSDFHKFMENYLNKNVKNQEFKAPSYCKLIYSDSKYNYYYADANDKKCYQDLHECNTKQDGQQYAMWCVVNGTVGWGGYTTFQFPFYVYVTYKNNIPVMLFNFGYDSEAQIKNIHDDPFTQYDEQLLTGIKQLAKKYNFDIAKNENDFETFNQTDELYSKQLDELNIDQNIISESNKYNGLNFIQQNIIYDFKKNKKAYLIANDNIVNLQGYKINLYLLNLLKNKKYNSTILTLAKNYKFLSSCSQQIFTFIIQALIDNKQYGYLSSLILADQIKDENQVKEIIKYLIDNKQCGYLSNLIYNDKIKDENLVKQCIQIMIDNEEYDYLQDLINFNRIKDENQMKQIIQGLIDNERCNYLYRLINSNKIKDENIVKQCIQIMINNKQYNYLYNLIKDDDKIKDENQLKQSIQVLIDNNSYHYLTNLIYSDKIKDENLLKQIIQIFIDKEKYSDLYWLIDKDKMKDENQIKESIQIFIDKKEYETLSNLIYDDKIKDENLVKQCIQIMIDEGDYNNLQDLIIKDRIKDENVIKFMIQVMIDKKQYVYLYELIYGDKIKNENKMKEIIQFFIDNEKYGLLFDLIKDDKVNQSLLTQKQKELLKKEKPDIKLSKKITKISTAKKLIELAKMLTC